MAHLFASGRGRGSPWSHAGTILRPPIYGGSRGVTYRPSYNIHLGRVSGTFCDRGSGALSIRPWTEMERFRPWLRRTASVFIHHNPGIVRISSAGAIAAGHGWYRVTRDLAFRREGDAALQQRSRGPLSAEQRQHIAELSADRSLEKSVRDCSWICVPNDLFGQFNWIAREFGYHVGFLCSWSLICVPERSFLSCKVSAKSRYEGRDSGKGFISKSFHFEICRLLSNFWFRNVSIDVREQRVIPRAKNWDQSEEAQKVAAFEDMYGKEWLEHMYGQ
jgi:hypothetical protein